MLAARSQFGLFADYMSACTIFIMYITHLDLVLAYNPTLQP